MNTKVTFLTITLLIATNLYAAEAERDESLTLDYFESTGFFADEEDLCAHIKKIAPEKINDINRDEEKNPFHLTPLHVAALKHYSKLGIELLEKGANVEEQDLYGKTVVHHWVESYQEQRYEIDRVEKLTFLNTCLEKSPKVLNMHNLEGKKPFDLLLQSLSDRAIPKDSYEYTTVELFLDFHPKADKEIVYAYLTNAYKKNTSGIANLLHKHGLQKLWTADEPAQE